MYKKIRIVICFTLIFCLGIMALSPVSNAEFALSTAVVGGIAFSVLVASGVYINSQNTVGSTLKDYFSSQVSRYVSNLGSSLSELFTGQVDYTDGDIQCDSQFQTAINNFLSWWVGDTNQVANEPYYFITDNTVNGKPVINQPASLDFPGCFTSITGTTLNILGYRANGSTVQVGNVSFPYGSTLTAFNWSMFTFANNPSRKGYVANLTVQYSNGKSDNHTVQSTYDRYVTADIDTSTSSSTIPTDFEGTIVTFIPPPKGTPTGNGNNSSGKNNIGLSAAVTGATIAGIVDAIDALYDKVATSTTPVEIPIIIIEEVPEPTPSPSPTPTPSTPFIPDGFEGIFNNLKNSLQNAQDTIDDVKEAVDTVSETTTETKDAIDEITEGINAEPDTSIDYKVSLTRVFPFCIPFDIYRLSNAFIAEPVTPHIDYTFEFPFLDFEYTLDLDLSDFDGVASLLRSCEYIAFCIGLAIATSKVIKW